MFNALLNALIQKGILSQTEAEQMQTQSAENRQAIRDPEKRAIHYVGIILPQKMDFDHFEEIAISWERPLKIQQKTKDGLSLRIALENEITSITSASTYIDLQMDGKKYEFDEYPTITATDKQNKSQKITSGKEYQEIFRDRERYVYRTPRHSLLKFKTQWIIGIPKLVKAWLWGGLISAGVIILFSIIAFISDNSYATFYLNARLLAGLAALIIGFRILLFHDVDLMIRWNYFYLILLGTVIGLILVMWTLHS